MVDVFISYARRERALMLPIKQRLEAIGLILFVDVDGWLDGEATFPKALDRGVRVAKAVLACWSPWSLTREWVLNECSLGKDQNKLVAVERVRLSNDDIPLEFYRVDRKPLTDFDGTAPSDGWAMTLRALATKLSLWLERWPDHQEAAAVRGKVAVLEQAALAEWAALKASWSTDIVVKSTHGYWQVVCKKPEGSELEICAAIQDVASESNPDVSLSVQFHFTHEGDRILRVFAPEWVLLPPGLGLQIDDENIGQAQFVRGSSFGVVAQVTLTPELVKKFATGKTAWFIIYQTREAGIGIPVSLDGYNDAIAAIGANN